MFTDNIAIHRIYFFAFITIIISCLAGCISFTPEPMDLDIQSPSESLDFCEDNPNKCLENPAPTFCEQYYGIPCCTPGLSNDDQCNKEAPDPQELVKMCSKDPNNPWCPTYEVCKSAETPDMPIYAVCKVTIRYPTPPTRCGTKYQGPKPKHSGLDIASNSKALPTNDIPINASWKGKVVQSLKDPETVKDSNKGLGNLVVVEYKYDDIPAAQRPTWLKSGESVYIRYSHLSDKDRISIGTDVEQGTMIGRVGSTGQSNGPHIHLETKSGPSNSYKTYDGIPTYHNPLDVFPGICA